MEFKHGRAVHALCAAVKTFIRDYIQGIADLAAAPNLPLPMLLLKLQQPVEMLRTAATIVQYWQCPQSTAPETWEPSGIFFRGI